MSLMRIAASAASLLGLAACATPPLPPATAAFDQVRAIQASGVAPMRVGAFTRGPDVGMSADQVVIVRAGTMAAPGGSFTKYLADTLEADLKAAGRYDPNATLEVTGLLVHSDVDSFGIKGHAKLGAEFTLTRDGKVVFHKRLDVSSEWDSDFIGAVAIPEAMNHYASLYQRLAGVLIADPDFRSAASKR